MYNLEINVPGENEIAAKLEIELAGQAKELVEAANGFEIKNDTDLGRAADLVNKVSAVFKSIEEERDGYVRPLFECERAFNGQYKALTGPLKDTEQRLKQMMTAFRQFQKREADKVAAAQRKEQRDKEAEAKAAGAQAPAPPPPAQLKPVSGDMGGTAELKEKWVHSLVDITEVPLKYLQVNDAMVKQAIRDKVRKIPGIRIYDEGRMKT